MWESASNHPENLFSPEPSSLGHHHLWLQTDWKASKYPPTGWQVSGRKPTFTLFELWLFFLLLVPPAFMHSLCCSPNLVLLYSVLFFLILTDKLYSPHFSFQKIQHFLKSISENRLCLFFPFILKLHSVCF